MNEAEAALSRAAGDEDAAFLSLYAGMVLRREGGLRCGQAGPPSQDWLDEMEVLAAIFMEDFESPADSKARVSTSFFDDKQEEERRCELEFWHPRSAPYPEEVPLVRLSVADLDAKVVLEMTRVSVAFAEELKGTPMIHDIVMNLPQALTAAREARD